MLWACPSADAAVAVVALPTDPIASDLVSSPVLFLCPPLLQVFHCRPLALAFLELTVLRRFHAHTQGSSVPAQLRPVLGRLCALYGLWALNQHMALLYRGEPPLCMTSAHPGSSECCSEIQPRGLDLWGHVYSQTPCDPLCLQVATSRAHRLGR